MLFFKIKTSYLKMKSSEKRFLFLYLASVINSEWSGCFVHPSSISHLLAFPKCDCNLDYFSFLQLEVLYCVERVGYRKQDHFLFNKEITVVTRKELGVPVLLCVLLTL